MKTKSEVCQALSNTLLFDAIKLINNKCPTKAKNDSSTKTDVDKVQTCGNYNHP